MSNDNDKPRGYRAQAFSCCANCTFGGYIGSEVDPSRLAICEILGEPVDGRYADIAVDPTSICDAFHPAVPGDKNA